MPAFILSSAPALRTSLSNRLHPRLHRRSPTISVSSTPSRIRMSSPPSSKKPTWPQLAIIITATTTASLFPTFTKSTSLTFRQPAQAATSSVDTAQSSSPSDQISLKALGIKRDQFVGERELRRRKTTQLSEAEQEIMELEEWEAQTESFRSMQAFWAGLISVAGIFMLYKGGVMWENWIKEQERKDMEEEIKLTGTFIDPRAVRKDEDMGDASKSKKKPKDSGPSSGPSAPPKDPTDGDKPTGGIDSLEKLFGQS